MASRPAVPGVVLRKPQAMGYVGLSETQFDDYVRARVLPQPIRPTDQGRILVWLKSELDAWLAGRIAMRDAALAANPPRPRNPVGRPPRVPVQRQERTTRPPQRGRPPRARARR